MPKTSYWKQKDRADAAEAELRSLKIRCLALASSWTLLARRSPPGSPRESFCDQHGRELKAVLSKAEADAEAPEPAKPDPRAVSAP